MACACCARPEAVSYTHLDVYKRQLLRRAERRGIRFRPLGELLPDDPRSLPLAELVRGRLAGREGWLGVRQP